MKPAIENFLGGLLAELAEIRKSAAIEKRLGKRLAEAHYVRASAVAVFPWRTTGGSSPVFSSVALSGR